MVLKIRDKVVTGTEWWQLVTGVAWYSECFD